MDISIVSMKFKTIKKSGKMTAPANFSYTLDDSLSF